jgi:ribosomal protein L37AE/L43A
MSIRTATMSNSYSPAARQTGFFRKLAVTLLFVVGIAGFMALFHVYQKNLSSFWMTVFAILSIGLASGAASRITFYHQPGFIRFFVVLLLLPLTLFVLGALTNWQMGIGPLNPWANGIIPQDELIQLGGAFLVAFICLDAWWKPASIVRDPAGVPHSPRNREETPLSPIMQSVQPRQQSHNRESLTVQPKKNSHLKFMKAGESRSHKKTAADGLFLTHTAQPARSRRNRLFNRKPNLQISLYEEHRCPFCLEEVKRNDPRGVKKCDVCNALHHADCWAVTGMCQVPHLNT